MPTVTSSTLVRYTPKEMFDLVNDVEHYPIYIPMCSDVRLLFRSEDRLKATVTMAKGRVKLTFTTENTMTDGQLIKMSLIDGPFKKLDGVWSFVEEENGQCRTTFRLDFEFASALIGLAFGNFFREASESMVEAFRQQAIIRYGVR